MPNYCQQIPGLGEKHTIRGSKYPIIVKNTQMLPKKYQTVAKKKTILPHEYLFLVMSYTIHSKNAPLLLKSTKFLPKIANSCEKEPSSSKIIPILATQRHKSCQKYPFLPQNSKILSKNAQIVTKITKFYQIFI